MGDDARLRATWRILLAVPVFLFSLALTAGVMSQVFGIGLANVTSWAVLIIVETLVFVGIFVAWARYLDRRPLAEYGIPSPSVAGADFCAGFLLVLVGFGIWYELGAVAGWYTIDVVMAYDGGSLVIGVVAATIAVAGGSVIQELFYMGWILRNAGEGLRSRGLVAKYAATGALAVTALLFLAYHFVLERGYASTYPPEQAVLMLGISILVLGAIYIQSGSLALAAGTHTGVNGTTLLFGRGGTGQVAPPELFVVHDTSLLPAVVSVPNIVELIVAYLLVVGWIRLSRGELGIGITLVSRDTSESKSASD